MGDGGRAVVDGGRAACHVLTPRHPITPAS